jgi:hypothetical protein
VSTDGIIHNPLTLTLSHGGEREDISFAPYGFITCSDGSSCQIRSLFNALFSASSMERKKNSLSPLRERVGMRGIIGFPLSRE